ncbi:MAG: hypothetical protein ACRD72_22325 [Candidatus Angelobacter sp.]
MTGASPALKFIIGWIVIIMLLVIVAKTELGHKLVYYFLWLAFASLVVVNYKFFQSLFTPAPGDVGAQVGQQIGAAVGG